MKISHAELGAGRLQALLPPVDVVPQEEVVCLGNSMFHCMCFCVISSM